MNCWPESLTGSGWIGGLLVIRCVNQNPQIGKGLSEFIYYKQQQGFPFCTDRLNHVAELVSGWGLRRCANEREHLRGKTHTYTHFEGHWTWGEWLGVNNIWSLVTQIPIWTSAMKHLPIKSNDACDLKGITVKWCIQRDYGHLQMASVQESAQSVGSPQWHKAGGWAREVFSHQ